MIKMTGDSSKRGMLMASMLAALFVSTADVESSQRDRVWNIKGIPVTGPNDVCGAAAWRVPAPFPPDAHFTTLGIFDPTPNALDAVALTPENCVEDAILATHPDPFLNALAGYEDADPRVKNVPLRQVAVKAFPDGTRMTLPSMAQSPGTPFPPTKSEPNDPITVGDWFKARGRMIIRCKADGTATVRARFRHLIPNAAYSLIGTWLTVPPGASQPTFAALAFGGVPSVVVADSRGRGRYHRTFSFCPVDPTPDGSSLMFIDLGYHMDGAPNGVLPSSFRQRDRFIGPDGEAFESTKPPGIVTTPAVGFPVNVGEL